MPVTAKLSKQFYEKLGDEVANELVGWFNLVDAQSRSDLRELLDSRLREFRAEVRADLEGFESRMRAEWKTELAATEQRLERRLDRTDVRIEQLEPRLLARVERLIAKDRGTQLRWTIGLWLSTILAVLFTRFA